MSTRALWHTNLFKTSGRHHTCPRSPTYEGMPHNTTTKINPPNSIKQLQHSQQGSKLSDNQFLNCKTNARVLWFWHKVRCPCHSSQHTHYNSEVTNSFSSPIVLSALEWNTWNVCITSFWLWIRCPFNGCLSIRHMSLVSAVCKLVSLAVNLNWDRAYVHSHGRTYTWKTVRASWNVCGRPFKTDDLLASLPLSAVTSTSYKWACGRALMTGYIRIVTARILYRSSDDRKGYVEWFYKRVICCLALQNGC